MTHTSRRGAAVALATLSTVLFPVVAFAQDHSRFLPGSPRVGLNGFTWSGGRVDQLTAAVEACGRRVGEVRFDQDTFTGTTPRGTASGGNAVAGGFWMDRGITTDASCRLGWAQVVRTEVPGRNEWAATRNMWFPDTNNGRTSPDYPGQRLPNLATPPNPGPTLGFQDFPFRFFRDGAQTWTAELALFTANDRTHELCLIGMLTWGFTLTTNPNAVARLGPLAWTNGVAANSNIARTLTDAFDGNGLTGTNGVTSTPWTINTRDCCDCFVPTPSSLVAFGLLPLASRRRRAA